MTKNNLKVTISLNESGIGRDKFKSLDNAKRELAEIDEFKYKELIDVDKKLSILDDFESFLLESFSINVTWKNLKPVVVFLLRSLSNQKINVSIHIDHIYQDYQESEYRKQVIKRVDKQGQISYVGREILSKLQNKLNLNINQAKEIEAEVLLPYQNYQKSLFKYKKVFTQECKREYPLTEQTVNDLAEFQEILSLGDEDVTYIQQEVEATMEIGLKSAKKIDYTKLRDLLAHGEWEAADGETSKIIFTMSGQQKGYPLGEQHMEKLPCEDLRTINRLWLKYSQGKFGFSVQRDIYLDLGGKEKFEHELWNGFCEKIGWRVKGNYLKNKDLTFWLGYGTLDGHLPTLYCDGSTTHGSHIALFFRLNTCRL